MERWDAVIGMIKKHKCKIGAEVGVYKGKTAFKILDKTSVERHYMIDPYEEFEDRNASGEITGLGKVFSSKKDIDAIYESVRKKSKKYKRRCKMIKEKSEHASLIFQDETLDYVFIDADHSYEAVKKDLEAWERTVNKGGWIGGHNYNDSCYPEVTKAVDERYTSVIKGGAYTWFVKK